LPLLHLQQICSGLLLTVVMLPKIYPNHPKQYRQFCGSLEPLRRQRLDAAVAATYGWPADISEEDALAQLLELNHKRAAAGR
jgi:hypothetical protein